MALVPGVGMSLRGVGVLDFRTGVLAFSCKLISLDFKEVELPEEAVDAGLLEASFFSRRFLSIPFSLGEWVGLARGEEGSSLDTSTTKLSSLLSPSLS